MLYVLPTLYLAMPLTVYVSAFSHTRRDLHSGLFLMAFLLIIGAFFGMGPGFHYRNIFFHGTQIGAWISYYYCESYICMYQRLAAKRLDM